MSVIHHKSKSDYLNSLNKKNIQAPDLSRTDSASEVTKPEIIKSEPTKTEASQPSLKTEDPKPELSTKAPTQTDGSKPHTLKSALEGAKNVAKSLVSTPPLPIGIPTGASLKTSTQESAKNITESKNIKINEAKKLKKIDKPAVIFIEGFELFSSGGNGLKDMASAMPGGKHFTWDQKKDIVNEIQKHHDKQPVVLVGHSFGADTAVEIAEEFNNLNQGYRPIDLLVTLDAVGFNHHVIPVNVKRNLNFFAEGRIPMLHGTAHVAKNPKLTNVHNELKSETHTNIDDSRDIQFEIFNEIKNLLNSTTESKNPLEIPVEIVDDVTKMIETPEELVLEVQPTINIFVLGDSKEKI